MHIHELVVHSFCSPWKTELGCPATVTAQPVTCQSAARNPDTVVVPLQTENLVLQTILEAHLILLVMKFSITKEVRFSISFSN